MKKTIIVLGIILVSSLILAGCVFQKSQKTAEPEETQTAVNEAAKTEEVEEKEKVEINVTKEDLNKLKSDIDAMEYEDLEALTE